MMRDPIERVQTADRRKFIEYALGSAHECVAWYEAADHPDREEREARLTSIRRLLAADQGKFES